MKNLVILFFLGWGAWAQAQIVDIPDAKFKNALLSMLCADTDGDGTLDGDADTNNDGEIQVSEASAVIELSIPNLQIASLSGVEYFSNLKTLSCADNQMEILHVTGLTNLRRLDCERNRLTSLDVQGLTNLNVIDCSENAIAGLDVQGLTRLQSLSCDNNQITSLTLQGLTNLHVLRCAGNQLTFLEVQGLTSLQSLSCGNNQITFLKVHGLTNLSTLHCHNNKLTSLEVQGLTNLQVLSCAGNQLTFLEVQGLTSLQFLSCDNNQITFLKVHGLTNLSILYCHNNKLTSLEVQGLTNLQELSCSSNKLTSLEAQGLTNLKLLDCTDNKLTSLEAQGLTNLQELGCGHNQLTFLEVQGLTNLQELDCRSNNLISLEVHGLTNLQELQCTINKLISLEVQDLTNLKKLDCSSNKLTSLGVQGLTNLETLVCDDNQLSTLDVRGSTNLQQLECYNNKLISLFIKNGAQETVEFGTNNPNLSYICCDEAQIGTLQAQVTSAGLTNCAVNAYCTFTPGGAFYTLQGEIKLDLENNGCDANDATYPYQKLNITDGSTSGSLISNTLGIYTVPLQAGIYTVMPILENPAYFTASPGIAQVTFPAPGNALTQNFCISANGKHHDMEVSVLPIDPLRPGFEVRYEIVYKNKGTQPESGRLSFNFDDNRMDFVSAIQSPDNQGTGVLIWNYTDLAPFETRSVSFTLRCNSPAQAPPVNAGDVLTFNALVQGSQPDEMPADNDFTLRQTVVGSFDPNDKTCLEGNAITPEMVGQYVHYLIRFENTGTYAAENIVVKDVIDTTVFELASLQITDASHAVKTRIGHGNEVEFIFENIQLPFAEATNDGYVAFKIKTKPTLVLGDSLKNKAEIYFDYNLPVVTNETHTTVQNPVVKATNLGVLPLAIFPNPVRELLCIQGEAPIDRVDIFDLSGKIIQSLQVSDQRVNVRALPNGSYWVKAYSLGKVYQTKMVKM